MFDNFLVRKDSLENVYDKTGRATGFKFAARNANFRGVYLSLHNGYYIRMDGVEYPRDKQKFEINGKVPRTFEEIKTAVREHWDFDDEGYVYVEKEGGLNPGMHELYFQQSVLAHYGYRPTDEEWVKTPPVPGSGYGSEKTLFVVKFELPLMERGDRDEH